MSDSVMLVCAVLASLASGVLVAHGVCVAMFRVFRMRAQQSAIEPVAQVIGAASILEG